MECFIVPPYLLERIAALEDPRFERAAISARLSRERDDPFRGVRAGEPRRKAAEVASRLPATPAPL
ncbi:MAG: hypothetical protein ABI400_11070, partial [Lacisediminihabitans sp.]